MITSMHPQWLRKCADNGTIKSYKTPSGHRRFLYEDLQRAHTNESIENIDDAETRGTRSHQKVNRRKSRVVARIHYIYVRAATPEAAQEQIQYILATNERLGGSEAVAKASNHVIVSDVGMGSGAFTKHNKGIATLIDASLRGMVGEVVVAHRDRLDRSGYNMLQFIIHKAGGKIISLDADAYRSTEIELAEEVLSILPHYKYKPLSAAPSVPSVPSAATGTDESSMVVPKKPRGRPPRQSRETLDSRTGIET
jgi:predicted site-specific integrase-resolvase